jgi:hypothetical protein
MYIYYMCSSRKSRNRVTTLECARVSLDEKLIMRRMKLCT